ncbi:ArsC family reductase [Klebsiella sp. K4-50]|nr:ArsC family reductase [Klebsiella sp. K4-50]MDK1927434.1 ArsC family reductase [Klebsiella sp. K4-50]
MENKTECKVVLYGISPKNCDTIKKARRWLEAHQIEYRFHDYRADGLERAQLDTFIAELGWQALLNTRGTTWRKLDESLRNSIDNADAAAALMLEMPAIIKRPLLCAPGRPMLLGFSEASYQQFNEV